MPNSDASLPADRHKAFQALYEQRLLGEYETISGGGSTLMATRRIRRALAQLAEGGFFHSLLDIGCGDFNWLGEVNLRGSRYTGVDCVAGLIDENRSRHSEPHIAFEALDIVESVPPRHDMVLCRDLFTHFPQMDIVAAFNNIRQSGARYLATTGMYPEMGKQKLREEARRKMNDNSGPGYWRPVNLCRAPFYLPPPLFSIPEDQPGKTLDVWRMEDLPELKIIAAPPNPVEPWEFNGFEFFRKLCALPFVRKIALFGSRARRTHRAGSDIDLMVFCDEETTPAQWGAVCAVVNAAAIGLPIEAIRYNESLATIPSGYFRDPAIYRTLYERPAKP